MTTKGKIKIIWRIKNAKTRTHPKLRFKKTILIKYSLKIKGRCIEQKETGSTTNKMRNAAKRKL